MLLVVTIVIFMVVGILQQDQLRNLLDIVASSPLLTDTAQTAATSNKHLDELLASEAFMNATRSLAYPYAAALGLSMLLSAAYYIVPTARSGMTLGKKLLRIKVVQLSDGAVPDIEQSAVRYFVFLGIGTFSGVVTILDLLVNRSFIPSNPAVNILELFLSQITYIISIAAIVMIIARADRRGVHDLLARTIVTATVVQQEDAQTSAVNHRSAS